MSLSMDPSRRRYVEDLLSRCLKHANKIVPIHKTSSYVVVGYLPGELRAELYLNRDDACRVLRGER